MFPYLRVRLCLALAGALALSCGGPTRTEAGGGGGIMTAAGQAGAPSGGGGGSPPNTGATTSTAGASGVTQAGTGGQPPSSAGGAGGSAIPSGGNTSGASGASNSGSGGASPFPPGVTKPRIMIVGDSISAGPGCYKKFLLKDLTDNHYSSFEFVGQYTDDCGSAVRHSAVSCSTAEQFTMPMFTMPNCSQGMSFPGMSTLVASHSPDLIMLQLGVNDVWNGKTVDVILGNYALLIQQARAHNPRVVLVVARIQKIRPDCSSDDAVTKRAESLVTAVPAWAQTQSSAESPVFVADLWTNSDWSKAETIDCVHPNDVGAEKMGMNWFNALKSILKPD
jgi:hypothetical protein